MISSLAFAAILLVTPAQDEVTDPADAPPAASERRFGEPPDVQVDADDEDEKPARAPRRREDDDEDGLDTPQGSPAAAGVAAGAVACFSAPAICAVLVVPCWLLAGVPTAVIPYVGTVVGVVLAPLVALFSLGIAALSGGLAGVAGWATGALAGKKRIPILPLAGAGAAGTLVTAILWTPATIVGLTALVAGIVFAYAGTQYRQEYLLAGVGLGAAGAVVLVVAALIQIACLAATGGVVGALAAFMGRGIVPGESALAPDMTKVPPPAFDVDEEDEEDRPRRRRRGTDASIELPPAPLALR